MSPIGGGPFCQRTPVHQEMFMLFFAHDLNHHHSSDHAWTRYQSVGKRATSATMDEPCEALGKAHVGKRKAMVVECESAEADDCTVPPGQASKSSAEVALGVSVLVPAEDPQVGVNHPHKPHADFVAVNFATGIIHSVTLKQDVYAHCGWCFLDKAVVQLAGTLRAQRPFFTCGSCFGECAMYGVG